VVGAGRPQLRDGRPVRPRLELKPEIPHLGQPLAACYASPLQLRSPHTTPAHRPPLPRAAPSCSTASGPWTT
jgi:hypothetical protein